jgi:hypothetical protein
VLRLRRAVDFSEEWFRKRNVCDHAHIFILRDTTGTRTDGCPMRPKFADSDYALAVLRPRGKKLVGELSPATAQSLYRRHRMQRRHVFADLGRRPESGPPACQVKVQVCSQRRGCHRAPSFI